MRFRGWVAFVGFTGLSASLLPCAGVFRRGEEAALYSEKALIAWNPNTKVEHFIRKAWFRGKGSDFAFLVPTPTEPTLGEASDQVYETLSGIEMARKPATGGTGFPGGGGGAPRGGVEVVKQQDVAGYKATVLKSNDVGALTQWLAANNYPSSPEIETWAAPYAQNNFYFTALKIDRRSSFDATATASVRISFRTPAPYYPYREPQLSREQKGSRTLKVYFISDSSYSAVYTSNRRPWNAGQFKAGDLSEAETKTVLSQAKLSEGALPSGLKLTVFTDSTVVRPESDLFFFPER